MVSKPAGDGTDVPMSGLRNRGGGNRTVATAMAGGIALPNPASEGLHQRLGESKVARFAQVGYKFERWIDVG